MRPLHAVTAIAVGASWACGDATAPEAPSGKLSVTLAGALRSTYEAEGRYVEVTTGPATFATGRFGIVDTTALAIVGFRGRGVLQDLVQLDLYDYAGVGDYAADGIVVYGDSRPTGDGLFFRIESGDVRIHTVSAGRAQGTFTAVATATLGPLPSPPDTLRLLNGAFDVPLLRIR